MAETPESEATTSADNTHWGIAYLREDLQDIRLQMREDSKELRLQIVETNKLIGSRFTYLITTMVAITGILIAVIKL